MAKSKLKVFTTTVTTDSELKQILALQKKNLSSTLSPKEKVQEGFVTVEHTFEVLKAMNDVCPHIIAKSGSLVVGYALCMHPKFADEIQVLKPMFTQIKSVIPKPQNKMNRTELFEILKERNQNLHDSYYEIKKISNSDTVQFIKEDDSIRRRTSIRVYMYGKMLFAGGYSLIIKPLEQKFEPLVIPEFKKNYRNVFGLVFRDFYKTDYHFDITIETDDDWKTFLDEFDKCLKFYEAEIFPKLTDIKFLAEYVGSVPFSNQLEIVVGSSYPVNVFKKLAILKWGDQLERYEEYKAGLLERFEVSDISKKQLALCS